MNKKVTIYNSNNQKFDADLILSFEVPEIDEKYIVYSFPSEDNDITINVGNLIKKDDAYYIEELNNEDEWDFVKKVMLQILREEI